MSNNFRPTQQLFHRPLRTNIDFSYKGEHNCPSMSRATYYVGKFINFLGWYQSGEKLA